MGDAKELWEREKKGEGGNGVPDSGKKAVPGLSSSNKRIGLSGSAKKGGGGEGAEREGGRSWNGQKRKN